MLLRADRDLLALAKRLNRNEAFAEIENWIAAGVKASDMFWNDEIGGFAAYDIRSGKRSDGFSNASALCFYADAGSDYQRMRTLENMRRIQTRAKFMMPSWIRMLPCLRPQRYWCGSCMAADEPHHCQGPQ